MMILAGQVSRNNDLFDKEAHAATFANRLPESPPMTLTGTFSLEASIAGPAGSVTLEATRTGTQAVLSAKTMGAAGYEEFCASETWTAIRDAGVAGMRLALTGKYRIGASTQWRPNAANRPMARTFNVATAKPAGEAVAAATVRKVAEATA